MKKKVLKEIIEKTYLSGILLGKKKTREPFLCVITPVFDHALGSVKKLVKDLKSQTFNNFIHILISNGESPQIKRFIEEVNKKDKRFIYDELELEVTPDYKKILENLGKRRDYSLLKYKAKRYIFLDADIEVVDKNYFAKLFSFHYLTGKDVLVTKTDNFGQILPKHPVKYGHIDMANYSFSRKKAIEHRYPTDFDEKFGYGNDYRYYGAITGDNQNIFLNFISAKISANRSYKRLSEVCNSETNYFKEPISVFGNSFGEKEIKNISQVFESHLVGHGKVVEQFEERFKALIEFKYAVATNSCTNSFWILLKALKFKKTDEIIIPNIHFFGIKGTLDLLKIKYSITDVSEKVPNISFESIKKIIKDNTRAIILMEYGGYPLEVKKLKDYLKKIGRKDIILILDAANSPFTKNDGEYTAKEYDYAIYSFDMNKILVTGDGGVILSNNEDTMKKCQSLAYYGLVGSKNSFSKAKENKKWWELSVDVPSLKLAMNNITAAIGLAQLDMLEENLKRRTENKNYYLQHLKSLVKQKKITLPPEDNKTRNNTYLFWIIVENEQTRDSLATYLLENKIYTTVKYQPLVENAQTPNSYEFYKKSLCLPLNQVLKIEELNHIVGSIYSFYER